MYQSPNPYVAPQSEPPAGVGATLSTAGGFGIIASSAVACCVIGAGLGYGLGRVAPDYYRAVFRHGDSPTFDPVQVGVGLGVTQGLIAGLVVGCVVVLATALSRARSRSGSL